MVPQMTSSMFLLFIMLQAKKNAPAVGGAFQSTSFIIVLWRMLFVDYFLHQIGNLHSTVVDI